MADACCIPVRLTIRRPLIFLPPTFRQLYSFLSACHFVPFDHQLDLGHIICHIHHDLYDHPLPILDYTAHTNGHDIDIMKDRRNNNNLSISTLSFSSNEPSPITPPNQMQVEKGRLLFLPVRPFDQALPSPLIKHAQEQQARQTPIRRQLVQSVACLLVLGSLLLWRTLVWQTSSQGALTGSLAPSTQALDPAVAINSTAPEVVAFVDAQGNRKWTVSIPDSAPFPLLPHEYEQLCSTSHIISSSIRAEAPRSSRIMRRMADSYYTNDPNYVQVHDALSQNVLVPANTTPISVVAHDQNAEGRTCDRSLTFVLEPEEAGFGKALMSLWLSYGLARRENRAFFIEDSRWQYGSYMSFFPQPPQASCLPPPPSQIVPCPHQAAHIVVSSATVSQVFGQESHRQFRSSYRTDISKQQGIFQMAHDGFKALYAVNAEDADFAEHRVASILEHAGANDHPVIGMHIRHGDRHPFEFEFSHDYLPLERFARAASAIITAHPRPASANTSAAIPIYIASDDPDVATDPDLSAPDSLLRLERAQDRIVLASNKNFQPSAPVRPDHGVFVKHVDEFAGWEGGFYAPLFRNLGQSSRHPHLTFSSAREQREQMEALYRARHGGGVERQLTDEERKAEENAAAMRGLIGRGYLLDLEVLSKSDHVVCAVSSATCRLLAVMMGWDKVRGGKWVNVDDGRGWSWDGLH